MKTIKGDLLELAKQGEFDAIIHGCNCVHNMGGGIANQIAKQFPLAEQVDRRLSEMRSPKKLGDFTTALITSEEHPPFVIINAYTQFEGGKNVDYTAIVNVMEKINKHFRGKKIGFPAIGAGIAGGNWEIISHIIEVSLKDVDATYVEFDPGT